MPEILFVITAYLLGTAQSQGPSVYQVLGGATQWVVLVVTALLGLEVLVIEVFIWRERQRGH